MLKEKLMEDLKQSMKDKNVVRKNVVQMVRAAILQFEKDNGIEVEDNKLTEKVKEIIEKTGATTMKDMGKVMKACKEEIGASADGKAINEVVKEILA